MNKNSRNNKLTIDLILLSNETTKFRNDAQCLKNKALVWSLLAAEISFMIETVEPRAWHLLTSSSSFIRATNLVTLNIRKRRSDRSTETPNDSSGLKCVQITSKIEPTMTWKGSSENARDEATFPLTTKSKILNDEAKYWFTPRPYILKSISKTNKPRKTNSAMSKHWTRRFSLAVAPRQCSYTENPWDTVFVDHVQWQHRRYWETPEQSLSNRTLVFWPEYEFYS